MSCQTEGVRHESHNHVRPMRLRDLLRGIEFVGAWIISIFSYVVPADGSRMVNKMNIP